MDRVLSGVVFQVSETEYWIYRVSARMAEMQCDRCARMHTDKNVECSATQGVPSPYTDTTMLYNFKTGAPVMRVPGGEVLHGGLHDAISILRIYV